MSTDSPPRLLRVAEVIQRTGLSRSGIAKAERGGTFPQRIKLDSKAAAWLESEVSEWILKRAENARFTLGARCQTSEGKVSP